MFLVGELICENRPKKLIGEGELWIYRTQMFQMWWWCPACRGRSFESLQTLFEAVRKDGPIRRLKTWSGMARRNQRRSTKTHVGKDQLIPHHFGMFFFWVGLSIWTRMILSYFEDPADPFKLQMPKIYSEAKEKLDELLTLKDTAKETNGSFFRFCGFTVVKYIFKKDEWYVCVCIMSPWCMLKDDVLTCWWRVILYCLYVIVMAWQRAGEVCISDCDYLRMLDRWFQFKRFTAFISLQLCVKPTFCNHPCWMSVSRITELPFEGTKQQNQSRRQTMNFPRHNCWSGSKFKPWRAMSSFGKKKAVKHKSTNEVLFHRLNLDDFGRYVGFALFLRLHFVDHQSSRIQGSVYCGTICWSLQTW